ncbi:hypothetical protein [Paenibacillus sp. NPDC093718]|uniref:hypothetical protein n=1 Tax=Paenibacillus sp. NPDC093718 TaxID=3390601 RepID=UPI003D05FD93
MKNRKFLVTFGYNLDHSNIDYLVSDHLSRYKGWIQKDYFDPVLHKGAAFILNYQIIDTKLQSRREGSAADRLDHRNY